MHNKRRWNLLLYWKDIFFVKPPRALLFCHFERKGPLIAAIQVAAAAPNTTPHIPQRFITKMALSCTVPPLQRLPNQPVLSCSTHGRALTSTRENALQLPSFKPQQHPPTSYRPFHIFYHKNGPVIHSSTPSTDKNSLNQTILVLSSQPSVDHHERKQPSVTAIQVTMLACHIILPIPQLFVTKIIP